MECPSSSNTTFLLLSLFLCYYIHWGKAFNCIHSYAPPFRPMVISDLCYWFDANLLEQVCFFVCRTMHFSFNMVNLLATGFLKRVNCMYCLPFMSVSIHSLKSRTGSLLSLFSPGLSQMNWIQGFSIFTMSMSVFAVLIFPSLVNHISHNDSVIYIYHIQFQSKSQFLKFIFVFSVPIHHI